MKVTITLSKTEVKALKSYLRSVSAEIVPDTSKKAIQMEIDDMVHGLMQVGALGDHYKEANSLNQTHL